MMSRNSPGLASPVVHGPWLERLPGARPKTKSSSCDALRPQEVLRERRGYRDVARPSCGVGLEFPDLAIPTPAHANDAGFDVDVGPAQCLQLASPEPGVHRGCPERAISGDQGGDKRRGFTRGCDSLSFPATAGSSTPRVGLSTISPRTARVGTWPEEEGSNSGRSTDCALARRLDRRALGRRTGVVRRASDHRGRSRPVAWCRSESDGTWWFRPTRR